MVHEVIVKNTLVDDGVIHLIANKIHVNALLFLELILCIVSVSQKIEACNSIQIFLFAPEWPHEPIKPQDLHFITQKMMMLNKILNLGF